MIARTQLRTKIAELLTNNEYKRHYYNEAGEITGPVSSNGNIASAAIDSLLDGYFNNQDYAASQSATIVLIQTTPTIQAGGTVWTVFLNDIPTAADAQVVLDAGFDPTAIELTNAEGDTFTSGLAGYDAALGLVAQVQLGPDHNKALPTYDATLYGAPMGSGVMPLSYNIPSSGDFFGDLNTFALVTAAAYELGKDFSEARLEDLKAQLRNLGMSSIS